MKKIHLTRERPKIAALIQKRTDIERRDQINQMEKGDFRRPPIRRRSTRDRASWQTHLIGVRNRGEVPWNTMFGGGGKKGRGGAGDSLGWGKALEREKGGREGNACKKGMCVNF